MRRAAAQDGHGDLDRGGHGADLDEGHAQQPDIGVHAGRMGAVGQGRVHEPAVIGRQPEQQRADDDRAPEQIAPVPKGRQARKGHVARAQDLGQEPQGQPLQHGDGEEEHHDAAMHREDLIIQVHVQERALPRRQLRADHHGQHAADGEEHEGRHHEPQPDRAVVDRGEEPAPARLIAPGPVQLAVQRQGAAGVVGGDVGAGVEHRLVRRDVAVAHGAGDGHGRVSGIRSADMSGMGPVGS